MSNENIDKNKDAADPVSSDRSFRQANKKAKAPWLIFLIFFVFIVIVFLNQQTATLNWIEDYQTGMEQARTENKTVLIVMFENRYFGRFTKPLFEETFTDPETVDFIHKNFVPILIDVKQKPKVAKHYKYNFDPTSYIITPQIDTVIQLSSGYLGMPYIDWLKEGLQKIDNPDK